VPSRDVDEGGSNFKQLSREKIKKTQNVQKDRKRKKNPPLGEKKALLRKIEYEDKKKKREKRERFKKKNDVWSRQRGETSRLGRRARPRGGGQNSQSR